MEVFRVDLTVVGAGFSGVCAAIAAARYGLKVALIGDRPVFGGNSSSEIRVGINGAATNGHSPSVYTREGGIVEELKLSMAHNGSRDIAYFEKIYAEPNIVSFLNTLVTEVSMDGKRIKSVRAVQLASERRFEFISPLFLDSTGDGFVAYSAGAEFMYGREAKSEYNEPFAPEVADDYTLGSTIMFHSRYRDHKIKFRRPDFAYDITKTPFFKGLGTNARTFHRSPDNSMHGFWWLEYGGQTDTISDNENIALELRKIVYGMWDYIKNSGKFQDVDNLELTYVTPVPGKRESRRFKGDQVLTQNHVDNKTEFDDAVAIAGWEMDVHAPKGIYDDQPATHWHYVAGSFNIPFSIMYSKNISNLFLAGRNMSSTHIAFGTTRLACTGGVAGQAVGTAAYLCKKYDACPRDIRNDHIGELTELLQHDNQTIIGKKEPQNPELYENLTITASSSKEYSNDVLEKEVALGRKMGLALPIRDRLDSFKVKVRNKGVDTNLKVSVYGGKRPENYIANELIREFEVHVPEGFDDWLTLPIGCKVMDDKKLYMFLEPNENIMLGANDRRLTGAVTFVANPFEEESYAKYRGPFNMMRTRSWTMEALEICFKDVMPEQDMYGVENVCNGYSRPYGLPNIWISQAVGDKGSESMKLRYDKPKKIKEIQLVFNSMLEEDNLYEAPRTLVKDYRLEIVKVDGQVIGYDVKDNFMCVNYFDCDVDDVVEVRIEFRENYGNEYFELYAVKMF